jgi:hypothetical protein
MLIWRQMTMERARVLGKDITHEQLAGNGNALRVSVGKRMRW